MRYLGIYNASLEKFRSVQGLHISNHNIQYILNISSIVNWQVHDNDEKIITVKW